jgi:hypothetical protein
VLGRRPSHRRDPSASHRADTHPEHRGAREPMPATGGTPSAALSPFRPRLPDDRRDRHATRCSFTPGPLCDQTATSLAAYKGRLELALGLFPHPFLFLFPPPPSPPSSRAMLFRPLASLLVLAAAVQATLPFGGVCLSGLELGISTKGNIRGSYQAPDITQGRASSGSRSAVVAT